jgi:biopolymer transport protein ExbD
MAVIAATDTAPVGEINMTPLIDVMLVLLVMFIITIPLQTDAVKIDLPTDCSSCPQPDGVRNKLVVTSANRIVWNGIEISKPQLATMLGRTAAIDPQPELHLQPEADARFELVDEILAMTKRAGITRMGFVGNEAYRTF